MNYFTYELPVQSIAQRHASFQGSRDDSRLLHLTWSEQNYHINNLLFKDCDSLFGEGDLLIVNDTKVLNSRFFLNSENLNNVEILLIEELFDDSLPASDVSRWKALAKPMKKLKTGMSFSLSDNLKAFVNGRTQDERFLLIDISCKSDKANNLSIHDHINIDGSIPIPPYIRDGKSDSIDKEMYQTVFAKNSGSVAAPTAGLHFTSEVLQKIKSRGVRIEQVTLHVGAGSFLPMKEPDSHEVFSEKYFVSSLVWNEILKTKKNKAKVFAVGTTVLRVLETIGKEKEPEKLLSKWNYTDLFIKPGFDFKVVDKLFTNFHQPKSTHLLLVQAFIGYDAICSVYKHALNESYKFLSYGDTSCLERLKF